ncbi:MAG: hypothetical protein SFW62_02325 [Alphaproteobacteria bacterium]|nr:hypothetical protein [Alphaproteobacteria bacterium]
MKIAQRFLLSIAFQAAALAVSSRALAEPLATSAEIPPPDMMSRASTLDLMPDRWRQLMPEARIIPPMIPNLPGVSYRGWRFIALPDATASPAYQLAPLLPDAPGAAEKLAVFLKPAKGKKVPSVTDIAFYFAAAGGWIDTEKYLMQESGVAHKAALLSFTLMATTLSDQDAVNAASIRAKAAAKGAERRAAYNELYTATALQKTHHDFFIWLAQQYQNAETLEGLTVNAVLGETRQILQIRKKAKPTLTFTGESLSAAADLIVGGVLKKQAQQVAEFRKTYAAFDARIDAALQAACNAADLHESIGYGIAGSESLFKPEIVNVDTGATGLFQYKEQSWLQAIKVLPQSRYGLAILDASPALREILKCIVPTGKDSNGRTLYGVANKNQCKTVMAARRDPALNAFVGMSEARTSFIVLQTRLGRDPKPSEMWLANILSPARTADFILAAVKNPEGTVDQLLDAKGNRLISDPMVQQNYLFRDIRDRQAVPTLAANVLRRAEAQVNEVITGIVLSGAPPQTIQELREKVILTCNPPLPRDIYPGNRPAP